MKKVAIIGSRGYPQLSQVRAYVEKLPADTTVVSGGARGVDTAAEISARLRGLAVEVYAPDYAAHGGRAPLVRNRKIVNAADTVTAFWDGQSTGTAHTIRLARQLGKAVEIVRPADD